MVAKSFLKCVISNALDVTLYDQLFNEVNASATDHKMDMDNDSGNGDTTDRDDD